MKKILQLILKFLAKRIIKIYNPKVVGITGSVGKTSTKEACFCVLSKKFNVRASSNNYNNEIGLPLTIIGEKTANKSISGWLKIFFKAINLIISKDSNYPKVLILEMGIDRPGDMDYLLKIVKPDIGIITTIGQSHIEYFKTINNTQREKGKLIKNLKNGGWAILNYDNDKTRDLIKSTKHKMITYGLEEKSDVRAKDINFNFNPSNNFNNSVGINFKLEYNGSILPIFLDGAVGYAPIYASLAASAVGFVFGLNGVEINLALKGFKQPKGRMNLLKGINNAIIIDDTYNSSPQSVALALKILNDMKVKEGGKKWFIMGDMLELGEFSEKEHIEVGKKIADLNGILVAIGEKAKYIHHGFTDNKPEKDNAFYYKKEDWQAVVKFLKENVKEDDLIFIKGSQGARMERIVKGLLLNIDQAKDLLVRQTSEWLK